MKLSYGITVCNELKEIQRLLPYLLERKREQDEIVVLYDNNGTKEVFDYLQSVQGIKLVWDNFNGHFADWKNKLTSLCLGDFIFQIDADELPDAHLIEHLPAILETNPQVEVYLVPRINTVEGLTEAHIAKWNWKVEDGRINFPDYQWRIYQNRPDVYWVNKVHERLFGHQIYAVLPASDEFCLLHDKTIEKQEKQNNYYDTL
jgi:hypothetical protein